MGASSANVTVTAPAKVGLTATAVTSTNIREIKVDIEKEMIYMIDSAGRNIEYPYDTIATFTWTIAAKVATVVIST